MTVLTLTLSPDHPLLDLITYHRRVLLIGEPGIGKTTLVAQVAASLEARGVTCCCLRADPGSPGFGPPGTVCLGEWRDGQWHTQRLEGVCTLDAARFRLPLVEAMQRLTQGSPDTPLLVDAPGVVRGVAGAELLVALARTSGARALAVLATPGASPPLVEECRSLGLALLPIEPASQARHPGRRERARQRTFAWNAYLEQAKPQEFDLDGLAVVGTPPPRDAPEAWCRRQVALLDAEGHTQVMGEITELDGARLCLLAPRPARPIHTLVIRDARRDDDELLTTVRHREEREPVTNTEPALAPHVSAHAGGPHPVVRLGTLTATLLNGVYGDPALHLRLRHQRRSLLFDLGDVGRQPARLAHQISDIFISHAHFDHIAGFMWLLRSRIGFPPCRLFGPPGLAEHLASLIRGILWDRVGEKAPSFEVGELHDERLDRYRVEAGQSAPAPLTPRAIENGVLHEEPGFRVRAATLDHGTPVLAFAFEPSTQVNVRKERLDAHGWTPGPWLGELKQKVLQQEFEARVALPDGSQARVAELQAELLLAQPGQRLVYATDFGDTTENRQRVVELARGAHTLFCEASFLEQQAEQARRTGHLTARACGEIATQAQVEQLVPFHFSRRHGDDLEAIYREVGAACSRLWRPGQQKDDA